MSENLYEEEFLKHYCHYPISKAQKEYDRAVEDKYRITTINWTLASDEETGEVDYSQVHKNIYEMTLGEFQEWFKGICSKGVEEDIVGVERIEESVVSHSQHQT